MDKETFNSATNFFPRLRLVVELESSHKHDQIVNVYYDETLRFQSLQIVVAARRIYFQCHCPDANPKLIFARNIYVISRGYDQEGGIGKTYPERSARQVEQGAFTCLEIAFNGALFE